MYPSNNLPHVPSQYRPSYPPNPNTYPNMPLSYQPSHHLPPTSPYGSSSYAHPLPPPPLPSDYPGGPWMSSPAADRYDRCEPGNLRGGATGVGAGAGALYQSPGAMGMGMGMVPGSPGYHSTTSSQHNKGYMSGLSSPTFSDRGSNTSLDTVQRSRIAESFKKKLELLLQKIATLQSEREISEAESIKHASRVATLAKQYKQVHDQVLKSQEKLADFRNHVDMVQLDEGGDSLRAGEEGDGDTAGGVDQEEGFKESRQLETEAHEHKMMQLAKDLVQANKNLQKEQKRQADYMDRIQGLKEAVLEAHEFVSKSEILLQLPRSDKKLDGPAWKRMNEVLLEGLHDVLDPSAEPKLARHVSDNASVAAYMVELENEIETQSACAQQLEEELKTVGESLHKMQSEVKKKNAIVEEKLAALAKLKAEVNNLALTTSQAVQSDGGKAQEYARAELALLEDQQKSQEAILQRQMKEIEYLKKKIRAVERDEKKRQEQLDAFVEEGAEDDPEDKKSLVEFAIEKAKNRDLVYPKIQELEEEKALIETEAYKCRQDLGPYTIKQQQSQHELQHRQYEVEQLRAQVREQRRACEKLDQTYEASERQREKLESEMVRFKEELNSIDVSEVERAQGRLDAEKERREKLIKISNQQDRRKESLYDLLCNYANIEIILEESLKKIHGEEYDRTKRGVMVEKRNMDGESKRRLNIFLCILFFVKGLFLYLTGKKTR